MGGKKDKRGKRGKGRPPRPAEGLALPKELRAAGEMLLERANSPLGREVLAAGVTALAAVAARAAAKAPVGQPAGSAAATPDGSAARAREMVDALGMAALAAAGAALTRLMRKEPD